MYEIGVDITAGAGCPDMSPDGFYKFKIAKRLARQDLGRFLWGTAQLYIPFFSCERISRFVIHEKGRLPYHLPYPHTEADDPTLCAYLGRDLCFRYSDPPLSFLIA